MALRKHLLKKFRITCLQTNAGSDWQQNLRRIRRKIKTAFLRKPHLIALPEMFYWRGPSCDLSHMASAVTPAVIREFQELASRHKTAFLLGSLLEPAPGKKFYNTSFLISETGKMAARYRKIHLFDNTLAKAASCESRHIKPGNKIVTAKVWGIRVGLAICYDLRFPELFRRLSKEGAQLVFLPANFTFETGKAHWEVLLRARAIENQIFIAAPAQTGTHPSTGIKSFGTTLIIDPWGKVLQKASRAGEREIFSELDLAFQKRLRRVFPVLQHRVLD